MKHFSSPVPVFNDLRTYFQAINLWEPTYPHFQIHRSEACSARGLDFMPPFRSNAFVAGLITSGRKLYLLGSREYTLEPGTLYFIGPLTLQSFRKLELSMGGYTLFFTPEFMAMPSPAIRPDEDFPFFAADARMAFPVDPIRLAPFAELFEKMLYEFESGEAHRFQVIQSYLHILFVKAKALYQAQTLAQPGEPVPAADSTGATGADALTQAFERLLHQHFQYVKAGQPSPLLHVNDYAERLHVHPNYLSDTVKQTKGKTATALIQDRMVLEAKSLLKATSLSVAEVAYALHFEDPSYFARYFKRSTGLSPTAFREQAAVGWSE